MISIKGLREGLIVICDDEPWLSQLRELQTKLDSNSRFFKGGQIALDVKTLDLTSDDLQRVQTLFEQYDVKLWAVLAQNQATSSNVQKLKLANSLKPVVSVVQATPEPGTTQEAEEADQRANAPEATDGLLVRKRVRSGQVLRHPGHIVVIGDVNPGAQIIAGGDIIIWGKLQGLAHAGALGDTGAVICALNLMPSLIRIADAARGVSHTSRRVRARKPEMALLDQQEINIVPWQDK
jgi:septum site-determining protein MinC